VYMSRRCGFRGKWCSWITHCIFTMWLSVLVNGTSTGFFSSSHDLRQGNLSSPLLFVIVMEALGRMIFAIVSGGLLFGFFVGIRFDCLWMIFRFFVRLT
jgi:uncharacterized membrane protein YhdT